MVDPIEEQVEILIDEIDAYIAGRYPFKLRDILEHPLDYKDRPTIMFELDKLKVDISDYFEKRKLQVREATEAYKREAAKATKLGEEIATIVQEKAKSNKKALIKPLVFARPEEQDEIVFVEKMEDGLADVIDALAKESLFIVDASLEVDEKFKVARWIFPGVMKNRALYVSFPINPAGALEVAKTQMMLAIDAVKAEIQTQLALEVGAPTLTPPAATPAPEAGTAAAGGTGESRRR